MRAADRLPDEPQLVHSVHSLRLRGECDVSNSSSVSCSFCACCCTVVSLVTFGSSGTVVKLCLSVGLCARACHGLRARSLCEQKTAGHLTDFIAAVCSFTIALVTSREVCRADLSFLGILSCKKSSAPILWAPGSIKMEGS